LRNNEVHKLAAQLRVAGGFDMLDAQMHRPDAQKLFTMKE
jgi:hypothetical protein